MERAPEREQVAKETGTNHDDSLKKEPVRKKRRQEETTLVHVEVASIKNCCGRMS